MGELPRCEIIKFVHFGPRRVPKHNRYLESEHTHFSRVVATILVSNDGFLKRKINKFRT